MTWARRVKLFFDGGCRPNPGSMECAVVRKGEVHYYHDQGHGTNSDAEWLAAIHALEIAERYGERDILLLGDSILVVSQANGTARCGAANLEVHRQLFHRLAGRFDTVRIRYVRRSQNLAGVALARLHPR